MIGAFVTDGDPKMRATGFVAVTAIILLATKTASPVQAQQSEIKMDRKSTGQREKLKDCAVKWKDEKATTNAKGRAAYNKFISGCLKGKA
jgi:hypothetical protein